MVINILLLGETGVGKSTFINALANYLKYDSLESAQSHDLLYFEPTKFTLIDDELQSKVIQIGDDDDEMQSQGVSGTQNPISYMLDMKDTKLRIIDTPGIGDERGIKHDEINADKILNYISQLDYLNAVCIMLNPNNARLHVLFEYSIRNILARLDKNVKGNILFLYTNSRSTSYAPGETHGLLKKTLSKIGNGPQDTITYSAENTFCTDNEAFRYLAASTRGVRFSQDEKRIYEESWNKSSAICKRMIEYISNLQPLPLKGTVTINECRRIITKLAKPVGDMIVHFQRAISRIQQHEDDLQQNKNSVTELKKKLFIPVTQYKVAQKFVSINSTFSSFGAQISLSWIPPFVHFNVGPHIEKTQRVETGETLVEFQSYVEDPNVKLHMITKQNAEEVAVQKIKELKDILKEYEIDMNIVVNAAVKFTVFLKENAIVAYTDVFEDYFQYLLKREQDKGIAGDGNIINNLEELLMQYKIKKESTYNVTPQQIFDVKDSLFALKSCGTELKHFYDKIYMFEDNQIYAVKKSNSNNV